MSNEHHIYDYCKFFKKVFTLFEFPVQLTPKDAHAAKPNGWQMSPLPVISLMPGDEPSLLLGLG